MDENPTSRRIEGIRVEQSGFHSKFLGPSIRDSPKKSCCMSVVSLRVADLLIGLQGVLVSREETEVQVHMVRVKCLINDKSLLTRHS